MTRRIVISSFLGVITAAALAWVAPALVIVAGWAKPPTAYGPGGAAPNRNLWWADDTHNHARSGVYTLDRHTFHDSLDMRRIIFMGMLADQPFYRQNPPPRWAAVISTDMREGFEEALTIVQGWPLRCVKGEIWFDWTPTPPAPSFNLQTQPDGTFALVPPPPAPLYRLNGLQVITRSNNDELLVPTRIDLWRAGANVGILSGAWMLLLVGPFLMRRVVRRLQRRCIGCGYDRRGLAPAAACPECGHTPRTAHHAT